MNISRINAKECCNFCMMKFDVKTFNIFAGLLHMDFPKHYTEELQKLKKAAESGKTLTVEIKVKRKHRSLNANAFLWEVLADMADKLHTSKDELYRIMLERYGVFTHYVVKPSAVDRVKSTFEVVRVIGDVTVNGQTGIQLQVYYGSSTYNAKEFSVLLDGVLSEAAEMGLEYISESDKALLLSEWRNKDVK